VRQTALWERHLDASMRRGVWFGGRALGQPRHRRRIRRGGRCEPEQGRAGTRRQPKLCRINRCRWRGRFLASRPGVPRRPRRQPRRPFCTRWISSGPIRVWRASCCDAESKASKLSSSWSNLFHRTHGHNAPYARRDKNSNLLERLFRPAREFGRPATRRAW
jgi:hypothetical protein